MSGTTRKLTSSLSYIVHSKKQKAIFDSRLRHSRCAADRGNQPVKCYNTVLIFTARRYASAVFAVLVYPSVRPSVCPPQAGMASKRLDESSTYLARRLPSTFPTSLCCKDIWVSPKIGVLPSGTLSQTPDFDNFATARRSRCQQNSSSSSSTVELVDDICTTVDESWLFTASRSTVTLSNSITSVCCGFVVLSTVDKILTEIARRAVVLRQQSLLFLIGPT